MHVAVPLYVVQLAATWFMTGLIWFVQIVHYPLFAEVGERGYRRYQASHMERTGRVVVPVMSVELLSALAAIWWRPPSTSTSFVWIGIALLAVVWSTTFLLHVPAHGRLAQGFDGPTHRVLVLGNWIRTVAWTGRAFLLLLPLLRHRFLQ